MYGVNLAGASTCLATASDPNNPYAYVTKCSCQAATKSFDLPDSVGRRQSLLPEWKGADHE